MGLLSICVVSCEDDEGFDLKVTDAEKPTAMSISPTDNQLAAGFMPGDSFWLEGSVTDRQNLETVTLSFTPPGATTPSWTQTWQEDDFDNDTLSLNRAIDIPANAVTGAHVLNLTAVDEADNTFLKSWNIVVKEED